MHCLCACWKSLQFNEIIKMLDDHILKILFYRMNSKDNLQKPSSTCISNINASLRVLYLSKCTVLHCLPNSAVRNDILSLGKVIIFNFLHD